MSSPDRHKIGPRPPLIKNRPMRLTRQSPAACAAATSRVEQAMRGAGWGTVVLAGIALVAAAGCARTDPPYSGYVEGEYLRLAAPRTGRLDTLIVREGDSVAAGVALFALESEKERAAV